MLRVSVKRVLTKSHVCIRTCRNSIYGHANTSVTSVTSATCANATRTRTTCANATSVTNATSANATRTSATRTSANAPRAMSWHPCHPHPHYLPHLHHHFCHHRPNQMVFCNHRLQNHRLQNHCLQSRCLHSHRLQSYRLHHHRLHPHCLHPHLISHLHHHFHHQRLLQSRIRTSPSLMEAEPTLEERMEWRTTC